MEIKWFYESIYDFYKSELGEKHPDTLLALGNLIDTSTILDENNED